MAYRMPLAEASGDEILSRVTYQIIRGDYDLHPSAYDDPTAQLFTLAIDWHKSGIHMIAAQLDLAAIWCAHGGTVASWLQSRIIPANRTAPTAAPANRTPRR
jgi:hypothetical protein